MVFQLGLVSQCALARRRELCSDVQICVSQTRLFEYIHNSFDSPLGLFGRRVKKIYSGTETWGTDAW